MSFWLTTHWPPLVGQVQGMGIWVPDEFESIADVEVGDLVWIFEAKSGPSTDEDGSGTFVRR